MDLCCIIVALILFPLIVDIPPVIFCNVSFFFTGYSARDTFLDRPVAANRVPG